MLLLSVALLAASVGGTTPAPTLLATLRHNEALDTSPLLSSSNTKETTHRLVGTPVMLLDETSYTSGASPAALAAPPTAPVESFGRPPLSPAPLLGSVANDDTHRTFPFDVRQQDNTVCLQCTTSGAN